MQLLLPLALSLSEQLVARGYGLVHDESLSDGVSGKEEELPAVHNSRAAAVADGRPFRGRPRKTKTEQPTKAKIRAGCSAVFKPSNHPGKSSHLAAHAMLHCSERGMENEHESLFESLEQQVVFLRRRAEEWKQRALKFEREVEELQVGVLSPPRQDERRFEYQVCSSPKLDVIAEQPTCYGASAVEVVHQVNLVVQISPSLPLKDVCLHQARERETTCDDAVLPAQNPPTAEQHRAAGNSSLREPDTAQRSQLVAQLRCDVARLQQYSNELLDRLDMESRASAEHEQTVNERNLELVMQRYAIRDLAHGMRHV